MRSRHALRIGLALCLVTPARADLLYFQNGGRLQHPAEVADGVVRLETPAGRFEFPETDFRKIVRGFSPVEEWPAKAEAARAKTTQDRIAAAWWALENGLVPECSALLRSAYKADPTHPLLSRLASVLDRLESPVDDPDCEPLLKSLGVPFQTERGPLVVLFHQHSRAEAAERLDLLTRVVTAYYLLLSWHGFDLTTPPHRLTSVYFKGRADYLRFLKAQNAGAFAGTFGYYHPTLRAVVAYDLRSSGALHAEAATLDRLEHDQGPRPDDRRRDLRRRRLLWEMEYRALDHGTAAHELVHQLVAVSGLASEPGTFPQWLHEGFAAQFEVVRGGRWAGIGRAHDLRLRDWRGVGSPDLASLVRDDGFGHGYRRELYARSWAAVYFLRHQHPRQFWEYLDALKHQDRQTDLPAPRRFDDAFRKAFGPRTDPLETEWRESMRRVSTPLEDHEPARPKPSPTG